MRKVKYLIFVFQFVIATSAFTQLFNDGANITIQTGALMHIQGDFTNQGGTIFNEGLIEVGGDWSNTVSGNPLNPGSGQVELVGMDQTIGGGFNTLFNNLLFEDAQVITLESTIGIQNEINISNGNLILNTNTLHILNSNSNALLNTDGGITAETSDVYGFVRWDIAESSTGTYTIPFINDFDNRIDLSYDILIPGTGEMGYVLASTFGTDAGNNPLPIGVTNQTVSDDDSGLKLVDRFWHFQHQEYIQAPSFAMSVLVDTENEIIAPNDIELDKLELINWEEDSQAWESLSTSIANQNVVSADLENTFGDFTLWSNTTSSVVDLNKLKDASIFPNPSSSSIFIELDNNNSNLLTQVLVYNELGQIVFNEERTLRNGNNKLEIEINHLNNGIHKIVLLNDAFNSVNQFVKVN